MLPLGCESLRASLSGRLTAFHPPDHKAGGSRHRDGGVLTVARFVGKVGYYLLVASLSGRLRASLSGRLTAFLPPDHKADGFRHCDTGVLTVARFVGKVGCYLLVASLSGRLGASLSGRLTAFHPPDHKAGGSRHRDGGLSVARFVPHGNWMTHLLANSPVGGCWARRPCHSLVGPPGAT